MHSNAAIGDLSTAFDSALFTGALGATMLACWTLRCLAN